MIKRNKNSRGRKNGFTLVELLAVIVILAIILVIAVPKIMSVIEDSKKATLESTAKMIASAAEKAKVQNTVLGKTDEITCESVAKISDTDYASCDITFENNKALVTIEGSGKFEGLYVCNGNKTNAKATNEGCGIACTVDEQKETHNYVPPYEVDDIDSCVSFVKSRLNAVGETELAAAVEPICNGQEVDGYNFDSAINMLIDLTLFTEEELVEADVIKEKVIEQVELCMPKKPIKLSTYITKILDNSNALKYGLVQTNAEYNGTTYDAGIRYVGSIDEVKNKVYYNCKDKDSNGVSYGSDNYDYAQACEVWRIIGVFDTKTSTSGSTEKRVKIINTNSTFKASWDSSAFIPTGGANSGYGINQWGESGDYEGADLMRLLNGYYISAPESTCTYCNDNSQATCSQTCTAESLRNANMKVLTNTAKGMIENAVWDTYGVMFPEDGDTNSSFASNAYLQEKGISAQYTGISECSSCSDGVERTTSWTGLVGLMSVSDMTYAKGWLYNQEGIELFPWTISPGAYSGYAYSVWNAFGGSAYGGSANISAASSQYGVFASVYLKSDIQIIGGDGDIEPYKLK